MTQLIEGTPQYIKGSGAKPYELKNTGGVYSCSCPAWRNQGAAINRRTCKHLKSLLGETAEMMRVSGLTQTGTNTARTSASAPNASLVPKSSPGCACEKGSTCDVSHDPATCPCAQCTTAEAAAAPFFSGPAPTASPDRVKEIQDRAAAQGRKLRPDEKAKLNGPPVLLAHSLEDFPDVDPTGWWMSEKLDGVRAYWDGKQFITRQGNVYKAPTWFTEDLPKHPLDGELWMGRKMFQKTVSIVKRDDAGDEWKQIQFVVFDMPHLAGKTFEERQEALDHAWRASVRSYFKMHIQDRVESRDHLVKELVLTEARGGEGLMIRKPGSLYEVGRSDTLLKVKPFKDAEAKVVAHVPGKGKHVGRLGGITLELPDGKTFNVGTGLTDRERESPPKIGALVTYRYTELTDGGIPKCASYVAVRDYE